VATLAQAGGTATGPLVAGVLAEWAPAPRELCYLLWLALTVATVYGGFHYAVDALVGVILGGLTWLASEGVRKVLGSRGEQSATAAW